MRYKLGEYLIDLKKIGAIKQIERSSMFSNKEKDVYTFSIILDKHWIEFFEYDLKKLQKEYDDLVDAWGRDILCKA